MSSTTRTPLPSGSQSSPSLKRKAMSITQTYFLAHTARGKLSSEAARSDHNLRLLVGHANLLDTLMVELAEAEQEQESWFNQSVRGASTTSPASPKHIQWADSIIEEPEADWQAEDAESDDSDSDSEYDEDEEMEDEAPAAFSLRRIPSTPIFATVQEISEEDEEFEDDGEEDYAQLTLTRTHSHSPPELSHDDSSDSEDDSMPPSPPSTALEFTEAQRKQIATTSFYDNDSQQPASPATSTKLSPTEQAEFFDHGFYLPSRGGQSPSLISAISVY